MKKIFIGLLFIFLNFYLKLGIFKIGLIPNFIGYILFFKGIKELSFESDFFNKAKPLSVAMGIFYGIIYTMELFGLWVLLGRFSIILNTIGTSCLLCILYFFVKGIQDIELRREGALKGSILETLWICMVVLNMGPLFFMWIPGGMSWLVGILGIGAFVITIVFIVTFYKAKNLYENLPAHEALI